MNHPTLRLAVPLCALAVLVAACDSKPPEPQAEPRDGNATKEQAQKTPEAKTAEVAQPTPPPPPVKKTGAKPTAPVRPSEDDPIKGKWEMEDAVKGLPPGKTITATIETDLGKLECKLFDDKAPLTVANFVGLARGTRPWKDADKKWQTKTPAYDGTVFHRIIKGFMIQGGDTNFHVPITPDKAGGLGTGEAGYVIPDEVWEGASHDHPGSICMANRGPNTNSAQFFIMDGTSANLDGGYTIFGECGPTETIHKLADSEVERDRAKNPPVIKKVTITRK